LTPGDEVTICYDEMHSNDRLMTQYGFTVDGNPNDDIALRCHLEGAVDDDAAKQACERLVAAADALPRGGADAARVQSILDATGLPVVIANHNAPDQVVVSGPTAEVEKAEQAMRAAGLTSKRLEVATAFHSPVVAAAAAPFAAWLEGIEVRTPSIPVFADATATP
jgi:acyl transferase domain-containing protein